MSTATWKQEIRALSQSPKHGFPETHLKAWNSMIGVSLKSLSKSPVSTSVIKAVTSLIVKQSESGTANQKGVTIRFGCPEMDGGCFSNVIACTMPNSIVAPRFRLKQGYELLSGFDSEGFSDIKILTKPLHKRNWQDFLDLDTEEKWNLQSTTAPSMRNSKVVYSLICCLVLENHVQKDSVLPEMLVESSLVGQQLWRVACDLENSYLYSGWFSQPVDERIQSIEFSPFSYWYPLYFEIGGTVSVEIQNAQNKLLSEIDAANSSEDSENAMRMRWESQDLSISYQKFCADGFDKKLTARNFTQEYLEGIVWNAPGILERIIDPQLQIRNILVLSLNMTSVDEHVLWTVHAINHLGPNTAEDADVFREISSGSHSIDSESFQALRQALHKPILVFLHYPCSTSNGADVRHWSCMMFEEANLGVTEEFGDFPFLLRKSHEGKAAVLVHQHRPAGCIILLFLAGVSSLCDHDAVLGSWVSAATAENCVLAIVEGTNKLDANLKADVLFDSLAERYSGFRNVVLHVVTHSTQINEEMGYAKGRVLWWGAEFDIVFADTFQEFLRRVMYFASKITRVNLMISLASCGVEAAVKANVIMPLQLQQWIRDHRLQSLTVVYCKNQALPVKAAVNASQWMPLVEEWIRALDKSTCGSNTVIQQLGIDVDFLYFDATQRFKRLKI